MLESLRWNEAHKNLIVLPKNRLVFCYIPKVACSNWKITFRKALGYSDCDEVIAHDRERSGLTYLITEPRYKRVLWLGRPDVVRAIFVRNPWTRVLSAFRSKLENCSADYLRQFSPKEDWRLQVVTAIHSDGSSPNFSEFITYLEETPVEELNEHWKPQVDLSAFGMVKYNFVGRFENLDKDAAQLIHRCKLPSLYNGVVKTVPKTHSSENTAIAHYYDRALLERVGRIYANDITTFGYMPPA
jgi:hypothetical protein